MAVPKSGDKDKANTMLWIAGTAAVTAGVYFMVQRYMKERDELMQMKVMKQLQKPSNPDGDSGDD